MTTSRFSTLTFVLCLLLSFVLVVHLLFGFLNPVVMAIVIVSFFSPIYQRLLRFCRQRDYLAASLATILVFLGVMIPLTAFVVVLAQQGLTLFQATQRLTSTTDISNWMTSLRNYLEAFNARISELHLSIAPERILNFTALLSQDIGKWVYDRVGLIAANLLSLAFNFFLTVALVFVFFVSGRNAKQFLMDLVPLPDHEKERLVKRFSELASAVFIGNGLISVLEGILGGLSFLAVQIPGALIFGVAMTITSFLPVVGASIVVLPATIYLFLVGETWAATAFLIFNSLQLAILETVVKPRLIGTKSQMHAVLVFMSVLAGIQIYGVFGLFYGPLVVTIFLALAEIYKEHYQNRLLKE
ncbi:MAG TPA: AI-2E family transporter [Myxococcota bacterium]|nr:AI-2E family transporter [Myxococcota bacterium]